MLSFVRYLLSAGAASVVDFTLAQALLSVAQFQSGLFFGVPVVVGALAGMSTNFVLSRRYAFTPDNRATPDQMRTFFLVSVSTLLLRLAVAYVCLALFSSAIFGWLVTLPIEAAPSRFAQVFAMGLVAVYSYFAHKHISFGGGLRHWLKMNMGAR